MGRVRDETTGEPELERKNNTVRKGGKAKRRMTRKRD